VPRSSRFLCDERAAKKQNGREKLTWTTVNSAVNGFIYDAVGDVTNDNTNMYLYDAEGRICAVQNTAVPGNTIMVGYIYDGEGRRVAKGTITTISCDPASNGFSMSGNDASTYVLGQDGEELTQLGQNNAWQRTNVFAGGKQIATYDTVGLHFQLTDPLGTRRMQTNADGQPETDIQSLPYGDQLSSAPDQYAPATADDATPLHFTGKERDTESGNDYFGARYYASSMGRFMSPDPAGPWAADVSDPQSWNFYAYARNNPLINIDPDGYDCVYLNNAGTDVDRDANGNPTGIDQNSNSGECGQNGGYWVDGTATSGTYDPNSNDITLNGYEPGTTPGTGQLTSASYTSASASPSTVPNMFVWSPTQPLPTTALSQMITSLNFSGQSNKLIGCIVSTESSGRPGVKNSGSSATGLMGVEKGGAKDVAIHGKGGTFQGMNSAQLFAHATDPAANIATGTALLKLKVGYAGGNVQNALDMYGTGAPYGQDRLACANGR
jgi:RHS repeat-associated protein